LAKLQLIEFHPSRLFPRVNHSILLGKLLGRVCESFLNVWLGDLKPYLGVATIFDNLTIFERAIKKERRENNSLFFCL
jgi:hypothetical protein